MCMGSNYLFFGMAAGLAYLGIVTALTIDNQLTVIKNDCYERLAIGQRLNPKTVYKSFEYNTLAECQTACTKEKNGCKAFSFGIGTKGNGTCELSYDPIKETADLKPVGTVTATDYDLYIKKIGCSIVVDKTPYDRPPPSPELKPTDALSESSRPIYENPPSEGPLKNEYPKPYYTSNYNNHHYLPPNSENLEHVQTLVSVASGPNSYLHPVHDILVGDKPYSYGKPQKPPRPSGCCEKNKDCCAPSDLPPFRPTILNRPYDDRPFFRPKPDDFDRPEFDRPRPHPHDNPNSYDRPYLPLNRPDSDYDRPDPASSNSPYNLPYDMRRWDHRDDKEYDRPFKRPMGPDPEYDRPLKRPLKPDPYYDRPLKKPIGSDPEYDRPLKGPYGTDPDYNKPFNRPSGPTPDYDRPLNRPVANDDEYGRPFKRPPRPHGFGDRPENGDYGYKPDLPINDRYDFPPRGPVGPEPYDPSPNSVYYDRPLPPKYGSVIPHPDYYDKRPDRFDYPEKDTYDRPPKRPYYGVPNKPDYQSYYDNAHSKPIPDSQIYGNGQPEGYPYDRPLKPGSDEGYGDGRPDGANTPYGGPSRPGSGSGGKPDSTTNGYDNINSSRPSDPNNPNGGYHYNKPNEQKITYRQNGSIITTSTGSDGKQVTSIITEIKDTIRKDGKNGLKAGCDDRNEKIAQLSCRDPFLESSSLAQSPVFVISCKQDAYFPRTGSWK